MEKDTIILIYLFILLVAIVICYVRVMQTKMQQKVAKADFKDANKIVTELVLQHILDERNFYAKMMWAILIISLSVLIVVKIVYIAFTT